MSGKLRLLKKKCRSRDHRSFDLGFCFLFFVKMCVFCSFHREKQNERNPRKSNKDRHATDVAFTEQKKITVYMQITMATFLIHGDYKTCVKNVDSGISMVVFLEFPPGYFYDPNHFINSFTFVILLIIYHEHVPANWSSFYDLTPEFCNRYFSHQFADVHEWGAAGYSSTIVLSKISRKSL